MRVHFVNENVAGHATMHLGIRSALRDRPDIEATFFDAPPRRGLGRVASAAIPGLDRFDLDLQSLRDQLVRSAHVRRSLGRTPAVDVLHVYTQNAGLLSVGRLRRQPTVVSTDTTNSLYSTMLPQREPTRFTPLTLAATRPFEQRVYDAARIVVAQTEWAVASLAGYGIPADRLRVIPFGIEVPATLERQTDPGGPRITFIGGSMTRKGGWRLIRLWRRHLRSRVKLTLVTRERVPAEPGLEVCVDITPGDHRLREILARTTVLAFPSEVDTFGYAAIEAMAAGVPVVGYRSGGVKEVVEDGTSGVLVPVGDEDALLAALERILGDDMLSRRMGDAGRQRVLERFDARVTTAALVAVLREARELEPIRGGSA